MNSEAAAILERWRKAVSCKCGHTFEARFGDLVLAFSYGRQGTRYYATAVRCTCQNFLWIFVPDEVERKIPEKSLTFDGRDERVGEYKNHVGPLIHIYV